VQEAFMSDQRNLTIVRDFYAAYLGRDREAFEKMMAPDFSFTSPYDESLDRAGYFERCWTGGDDFARMDLLQLVEDHGDAFVIYEAQWKDGRTFKNAEYLRLDDGLIQYVEVYFGTLADEMALSEAGRETLHIVQ
jgi:ketosteroid isomerase-like protein